MNFKGILFDLDGTLIDSLADLADAVNATLRTHGLPEHGYDAYRYFIGEGVELLIHRALPAERRDDKSLLQACLTTMRAEYGRGWNRKTKPYPGVPELLDALSAQGVKMAILSNKPDPFTQECVRHFLSRWSFEIVAGAKPDVPRKPDPQAAVAIAEQLHILPQDWCYLGDSAIDMQTARAAGMYPVGALWGFRTREELLEHGARKLVSHPAEILQ